MIIILFLVIAGLGILIYSIGIEIRENRKVLNMIDTKLGYIRSVLQDIKDKEITTIHTYDCTEYPKITTTKR
ncbi:MAG: hypothetical protein IIZ78_11365 [Clostridiales bacterium]|nr:hypothetical protein [Clostridiales bacterium]